MTKLLFVTSRSSTSRQESVQSSGPTCTPLSIAPDSISENKLSRDPLRKSPREFIIPITVEGAASGQSATIDHSNSSSSTRTSRFDRTKRYGYYATFEKLFVLFTNKILTVKRISNRNLYHEGETDFDQPSTDFDSHPASPLHHLQRLSSFKKSHDEP